MQNCASDFREIFFSLKCVDTLGLSTPTWSVDGDSDYDDVANVNSVDDLGMSVISINWPLLADDVARVKCRVWRKDLSAWKKRCGSSRIIRSIWRPENEEEEEE